MYCSIQLKIPLLQKGQSLGLKTFQCYPQYLLPIFYFGMPLNTGFAELLRVNPCEAVQHMAGRTFFDNDVDGALALQVPLVFNRQSKLVRPNLEAGYSGNAAVGVLQLDAIGAPNQSTRGSV